MSGFSLVNIVLPGTNVMVHRKTFQCWSWVTCGGIGFYIGIAPLKYQSYTFYIIATLVNRISATVDFPNACDDSKNIPGGKRENIKITYLLTPRPIPRITICHHNRRHNYCTQIWKIYFWDQDNHQKIQTPSELWCWW